MFYLLPSQDSNSLFFILFFLATILIKQAQSQELQTTCQLNYYFDSQQCEDCQFSLTEAKCMASQPGVIYWKVTKLLYKCSQEMDTHVEQCCIENDFEFQEANHVIIKPPFRSTQCQAEIFTETKSRLFGGYCHTIYGCVEYEDFGTCQRCHDGFYLRSDKTCARCSDSVKNCFICSSENICISCNKNYYLDLDPVTFNQVCYLCTPFCVCENSKQLCTGCISDQYFLKDKKCLSCNSHQSFIDPTRIQRCTADSIVECQPRSIISSDQRLCIACPDFCEQCELSSNNKISSCLICSLGFYLKEGQCNQCLGNGIATCNNDGQNATSCFQIYDNIPRSKQYFLFVRATANETVGICVLNTQNCQYMNVTVASASIGACQQCYDGYYLTDEKDGYQCKLCKGFDPFCTQCKYVNGVGVCQQCLKSQKFSGDNWNLIQTFRNYIVNKEKQCTACSEGCRTCLDTGVCEECIEGYRKNIDICQVCGSKWCQKCEGYRNQCQECISGYKISDEDEQSCEACELNCIQCLKDRKQCEQCAPGFYLIDDSCHPEKPNCAISDFNGKCLVCQYGYRLLEGFCFQCANQVAGYVNCISTCGNNNIFKCDGDTVNQYQCADQSLNAPSVIINSFGQMLDILLTIFILFYFLII